MPEGVEKKRRGRFKMRQITAKRSAALLLATLSAALLLCGCVESDEKSTEDGPVEITFETTAPAPQVSEQTTQAPEATAEAVLSLPAVPEHILIGSGGASRMLAPGDAEFEELYEAITARRVQNGAYAALQFGAKDKQTKEHRCAQVKREETYAEFLYEQAAPQGFSVLSQSGEQSAQQCTVQRILYPLSGKFPDLVFLGGDSEYADLTILGFLAKDEALSLQVQALLQQE